ncbi:hypothetical protein VE03_10574 [Pseudogymnoascus sp. 23342-1-I1]|nr:hypothetical protein VE03_10574 [Pseudogymnoascus sp. 23342-1-I1]
MDNRLVVRIRLVPDAHKDAMLVTLVFALSVRLISVASIRSGIHKPLMNILATATNSRVLYYALGCLTNLAIPPRNKTELGKAGLLGQLPHLWSVHTLPHIQSSAISLTRQLLIGNSPNVLRISAPLSNDPDSPATEKSGLSALISIFMRSNTDLARMEIARALATVCQVLASDTSPYKINQTRRREVFERNRDIGVPLCFMLLQLFILDISKM